MDITPQQRRPQQSRPVQDDEDDGRGEAQRDAVPEGRRLEAATIVVAEAVGPPAPNTAELRSDAVQGMKIEGCAIGAPGNNNNGSGAAAAAATPTGGNNGTVQEQIPAIVDRYVLHGKIDRGTFSTVTLATRRDEQHLPMDRRRMFAIKLITQTSHPTRIEREIRCMMTIGGRCNVVEIVDGFRHQGSVGLVMNYIPHEPFLVYYALLSPAEVQRYMRQLLIALDRVHQHGVIHRDVKPSNFLHSRRNGGSFMLVDFGLAQETLIGQLTLCPPAVPRADKRKDFSDTSPTSASPATGSLQPSSVKRHRFLPRGVENGMVGTNTNTEREQAVVRNPLKQQQQQQQPVSNRTIWPLKVSNNVLKDLVVSPLARQIKSTIIGIGTGLKSRRSVAATGAAPPAPVPQRQGCSERENIGVGAGLKHHRQSITPGHPGPAPVRQPSDLPWCECYGKAQVCNRCLVKRELHAPRAGTPGYRPPEVLLKYPDQTTAVDIWAAGVIFLSLLSKCYPFFGNTDDMTSLAQIISVFGFERMLRTAHTLDRRLQVAEETMRMRALSLRRVCQHYRALVRKRETSGSKDPSSRGCSPPGVHEDPNPEDCCSNCVQPPDGCLCQEAGEQEGKDDRSREDDTDCDEYGAAAYDLLERLLETDPHQRITAAAALQHPYFELQY